MRVDEPGRREASFGVDDFLRAEFPGYGFRFADGDDPPVAYRDGRAPYNAELLQFGACPGPFRAPERRASGNIGYNKVDWFRQELVPRLFGSPVHRLFGFSVPRFFGYNKTEDTSSKLDR
jgi:hypothetical protein